MNQPVATKAVKQRSQEQFESEGSGTDRWRSASGPQGGTPALQRELYGEFGARRNGHDR
jgi:hypothetical protein